MNNSINSKLLPFGEWMAENAYISPGKHRLLTATGLMAGLFLGHEMMNILTAKNNRGEDTNAKDLAPPLRKFHGCMAYNKHEDTAYAKWHKVADAFVPLLFGAVGAMAGSSSFARGTPMMKGLKQQLAKGTPEFRLQHADMLANKEYAKRLNWISGAGLNMGSTSGVHLFPSMIASSTSAFRFQIDHGKNIILPGLRQLTNNRGHSSRNMFITMGDFTSWAQSNAAHYTNQQWFKAETKPLLKYTKDMMQLFKQTTPQQRQLVENRLQHLCEQLDGIAAATAKDGQLTGNALQKELARSGSAFDQKLKSFLSEGLEQSFIDSGLIDPKDIEKSMQNVALGDHGLVSRVVSILGGKEQIKGFEDTYKKALNQRHAGDKTVHRTDRLIPSDAPPYLTATSMVAGTLGAAALLGGRRPDAKAEAPEPPAIDPSQPRHLQARQYHAQKPHQQGGVAGFINGKPLDTLSWISGVLVVPPGLHRFMNAAMLSGFLMAGAKVSSTLAARDLKGAHIAEENVHSLLKPLYGKMEYVWKSANPSDRWKHVAHQLMPVTVGMGGTYLGSRLYFQDAIQKTQQAEYLEDYTDRILMQESETYAKASALTSVLNTGSGFHLLPFVSYPSNLQNRFLMAKGQQIASPGVGKWWSGNPSKYPWHVKRHLGAMIEYAVNNTSEFPAEFDEMGYALLAKLFPDIPKDELNTKRDMLLDKIYTVRDQYWQQGGIPEAQKDHAKAALEGILRREGLEKTLLELELDPLQASLDNNGMGAKLAHLSGAAAPVRHSVEAYRQKAATRMQHYEQTQPETTIDAAAAEEMARLATHPAPKHLM